MKCAGELSILFKNIENEYGSDTPVCIQIKDQECNIVSGSYVYDISEKDDGTIFLIGTRF